MTPSGQSDTRTMAQVLADAERLEAETRAAHEVTPTTPAERATLRVAYEQLVRADYFLGDAARALGESKRPGWEREADSLMRKCIELREAIQAAEL